MNTTKRSILTGIGIAALIAPTWAAHSQITARLEPQTFGLGEAAQLEISVDGSRSAEPRVPDVDGLEIVPVGQQSSMQMINGAVTASTTHIYQVTATRAGSFTIPAIGAPGGGSTQPIALRVDRGSAGQSQQTPAQTRSSLPAPSINQSTAPVDAKNESAFLRVVLPKRELTVGELVPVEVKAYFRAGVSASLNGLPMLSSDAFALNKLGDNPEQTRESVNGVPYTVVTWTSSLSAVKAGDSPLNLDLPVMVRIQEKAKRRSGGHDPFKDFFGDDSPFGDAFGDSFFDNFFGGTTEKPLTLHTDGAVVKIKALPSQGRPAAFSGAVGAFDVASEAANRTGTNGDPMKLKITVTGRGNFSRVSTEGLRASSDWKTYKPNVQFEPSDSGGTTGTKTFEQSIVPVKAGAQEIPAVSFSYFDPEKDTYVTKTTNAIPVEIAQNTAVPAPVSTLPAAAAPAAVSPETSADGLASDMIIPDHANGNLQPLVRRTWFIALNSTMLALLAIGAAIRNFGARRTSNPERLQREATELAVRDSVAAMNAALATKDAQRFFDAARHALQERLAAQWHVPVSQVTISEIRTRLNGHGEAVSAVFKTADEIAYSGRRFTAPDLTQWRDFVESELHQLARI